MSQIEVGDIVHWTFDYEGKKDRKPIPFSGADLWVGIVTKKAKHGHGIEVYWFNNNVFKVMELDGILLAANFGVKDIKI